MAEKKIKYSDLAEDKLFQPAIDSANELLKVLSKLEDGFKDLLKESKQLKDAQKGQFNSYERIKNTEEAINKAAQATKNLDRIEKERIKLQQKLKDLEEGRLTNSIQLREQIRVRTRDLRQEFREQNQLSTSYERQSARLTNLRKKYKDLAVQNKANTKEAKALLKEIQQLDKKLKDVDEQVGQNQRSVGNYRIAVDRLTGSFKLLAASGVVAALAQIVQLFNQNTEGSAKFQKVLGRITVTFSVLVGRFVKAIPLIEKLFLDLGTSLSNSFDKFILGIERRFASLPSILGGSTEKIKEIDRQLGALNAQEVNLTADTEALAEAFAGVGEEINSLIDTNDRLIDQTIVYQKQINALNEASEKLRSEQRLLQIASDDNSTSLEVQTQATIDLLEVNNKLAANEAQVAAKRLELAQLNAKVNKNNLEAQTELAEAVIALEAAKGEASAQRAEGERRLREIERDNIELDLDQLIDIADRRKTINEQIASDERVSLEDRRNALNNVGRDIEASFRRQAEVIQQGLGVSFNIDDLINEEDTVKLNERIKAIGLDEIRQNRLREIIQERLQAVEDLRKAQDDLNATESEAREIQSDILLQEEALKQIEESRIAVGQVLSNLEEKRLQNEIDNIRIRINLAKEGSTELLELNQQLNDKLLEQDATRISKQQKQQQEAFKLTFDFVSNFIRKRSEATNEAINNEIASAEKRAESLRALARQGVENADESIAVEEKKIAELEAKREAALKRQARQELLLTGIETYNAKLQAGEPNPLAATVIEIAALEAFINSLPGFYEGSEMVANDLAPTVGGKDGYLIRVDGQERILNPAQNAMVGNMSNNDLATLAANHQRGISIDNSAVVAEVRQLQNIVKNQPVYLGRDYDATKKAVIDVIKRQGKIERNHRKNTLL